MKPLHNSADKLLSPKKGAQNLKNLTFTLKALCINDFRLYPGWSTILKPEEPLIFKRGHRIRLGLGA